MAGLAGGQKNLSVQDKGKDWKQRGAEETACAVTLGSPVTADLPEDREGEQWPTAPRPLLMVEAAVTHLLLPGKAWST